MESDTTTCKSRDMLSSPWQALLLFWLPAIAIVVAGSSGLSVGWRTIVWTAALGIMGQRAWQMRCGVDAYTVTSPALSSW
jgi:hypothetical protein